MSSLSKQWWIVTNLVQVYSVLASNMYFWEENKFPMFSDCCNHVVVEFTNEETKVYRNVFNGDLNVWHGQYSHLFTVFEREHGTTTERAHYKSLDGNYSIDYSYCGLWGITPYELRYIFNISVSNEFLIGSRYSPVVLQISKLQFSPMNLWCRQLVLKVLEWTVILLLIILVERYVITAKAEFCIVSFLILYNFKYSGYLITHHINYILLNTISPVPIVYTGTGKWKLVQWTNTTWTAVKFNTISCINIFLNTFLFGYIIFEHVNYSIKN